MTPSDSLYKIIHALSKNEKSYFKKMSHLFTQSKDNKYVVLFDIIGAMNTFDDEALKNKLNARGFNFELSTAKTQLKQMILRSLRLYHENKKSNLVLSHYVANVQLLFAKGFISEALKEAERGLKEAKKREDYSTEIELHSWKLKLVDYGGFNIKKKLQENQKVFSERMEAMRKYQNEITIKDYWDRLYLSFLQNGQPTVESEKQIFIDLVESFNLNRFDLDQESRKSKMYWFTIKCFKEYILLNLEKQEEWLYKSIAIAREDKLLVNSDPVFFSSQLANYGIVLLRLRRMEEVEMMIREFHALSENYECYKGAKYEARNLVFVHVLECQKRMVEGKGDIEEIFRYFDYLEEDILKRNVTVNLLMDLLAAMAGIMYVNGEYEKARKYIFRVINQDYEVRTRDFKRFVRLLLVVILDKLNDIDFLVPAVISYRRKMTKNTEYKLDKAIFDFMYKKYTTKRDNQELLEVLQETLRPLADQDTLVFNYLFDFPDYFLNKYEEG